MNQIVHASNDEISQKIWAGEYFGQDGAIKLGNQKYVDIHSSDASNEEKTEVVIMLTSTYYSTLIHCIAHIKKFHFSYIPKVFSTLHYLFFLLGRIIDENLYKYFNASQKEVLMAILLACHYVLPFAGYRRMAIDLGEKVLSEDFESKELSSSYTAEYITRLFVKARLSRLRSYTKREECKKCVYEAIHHGWSSLFADGHSKTDWKTVNRLARLINDKKMVVVSAPLANSADVLVKSGL